jgi:predicted nucleotidyltransferase
MLFRTFDAVLGSVAKVRILRALLPLSSSVSGNEARLLAGIRSKSGMRAALDELTDLGILECDQTRRIRLFRVNGDHELVEPLRALFRAEATRLTTLRGQLQDTLDRAGLATHTLSVILFGSNARGDARPASDVDLLVVTSSPVHSAPVLEALMEAVPRFQGRLGLRLSPYVLDESRAVERYRAGDPLMQNVLSEGRTLYGTPFHEMVGAW